MYVLLDTGDMTEIAITEARGRLASIIDSDQLSRLLEDCDELAGIRAADAAWEETERLSETPIPWEDVKRDLGLA